jgi:hypothetical protein
MCTGLQKSKEDSPLVVETISVEDATARSCSSCQNMAIDALECAAGASSTLLKRVFQAPFTYAESSSYSELSSDSSDSASELLSSLFACGGVEVMKPRARW